MKFIITVIVGCARIRSFCETKTLSLLDQAFKLCGSISVAFITSSILFNFFKAAPLLCQAFGYCELISIALPYNYNCFFLSI
jgi:hypothetical protein